MFFEAWLLLGLFVGVIVALFAWSRWLKSRAPAYRWEPEQDYDLVQRGESSMTPAFPELVKREKKKPAGSRQKGEA